MLDMDAVTDYHRTDTELEEFLVTAVCVAGKMAFHWAAKAAELLGRYRRAPFRYLRRLVQTRSLGKALRAVRMGQYRRITNALRALVLARLDLRSCSVEALEALVGFKTARFFILHSRRGARLACPDTHWKKFMRELGHYVPETLTRSRFLTLQTAFLAEADRRGLTAAELDLTMWKRFRRPRPALPGHLVGKSAPLVAHRSRGGPCRPGY